MGDDDVRHKFGQSIDGRLLVLVDIDDQVRGRELADALDIDRFGAAHLGHARKRCARVGAKPGATHQPIGTAQFTHQFGEAGNQRDDARRAHGALPAVRALRGARANSAS